MASDPGAYEARWGYRDIDARRYERRRYRRPHRRLNYWMLERALGRALREVRPGGLVLDMPCGAGIVADALRARGFRVVGGDISAAMLAVARERPGMVGHVRADVEHPPFRPQAFDAVVCSRFLMHLPSATRVDVLRQLASLTRGPIIATVCHPYTLKTVTRGLRRFLWGRAMNPRLTRTALVAEVTRAGLRLGSVLTVVPVFSEVWVAVINPP